MGEVTEKIYCCDRGDNDNALAAAILAGNNRRDDWGPMAAMMGGGMNNCYAINSSLSVSIPAEPAA